MDAHDFWKHYAGGLTPADFMRMFGCSEPEACAAAYVRERPHLYGIVRWGTWRETFEPERQHTRLEVQRGLAAYLEETRPEWETELAAGPPAPRPEPSRDEPGASPETVQACDDSIENLDSAGMDNASGREKTSKEDNGEE